MSTNPETVRCPRCGHGTATKSGTTTRAWYCHECEVMKSRAEKNEYMRHWRAAKRGVHCTELQGSVLIPRSRRAIREWHPNLRSLC